jgi:mRNA interferase MazF
MPYIPSRGDVVWLDFDPQAGHEQAGRRPALILSPQLYNRNSGLAVCCPITNQAKGYPYEVKIPEKLPVTGVILADQIRNLDWQTRKADFITRLPQTVVDDVVSKVQTLLT